MGTIFSETLTKLRKEAGFPTAYRFYHDNGGAPVLKISYRKYLAIEQGKNLPVFGRLTGLLFGLRVVPKSAAADELVTAWLKTMAGEETFKDVLEPMLAVRHEPAVMSPMHKAMKKALAGKKYYITPKQLAVISESRDNYLCFLAMSNDTGTWSAGKFASAAGLTEKAAEKAVRSLAAVKILKKAKNGQHKCPLAAEMVEYPHLTASVQEMIRKLLKYQEELIAAGSNAWMRRGIIRADADALCGFFPIMGMSLSTAHSYAVTERTAKSAIYSVEARIVKLRDF